MKRLTVQNVENAIKNSDFIETYRADFIEGNSDNYSPMIERKNKNGKSLVQVIHKYKNKQDKSSLKLVLIDGRLTRLTKSPLVEKSFLGIKYSKSEYYHHEEEWYDMDDLLDSYYYTWNA